MISVMNMEEEFPVVFTIWEDFNVEAVCKPVWENFCSTVVAGRPMSSKDGIEWTTLMQTTFMVEHRGIIGYNNDIRFRTPSDLTLFLLRFS